MKKTVLVLFVLVLAFSVFANAAGETKSDKISSVILTDSTGVDDDSFNAAAWRGIKEFYANEGEGTLYKNIKAQSADEYTSTIDAAVAQGFDLIITTGFTWGDAVAAAAAKYPNQKMIIVDVNYLPVTDNLIQYIYEEEQGSYLVGVCAAKQAIAEGVKNPKFGFIGGIPGATITKFEVGFIAGVKSVLPNATFVDFYTNNWDDTSIAKTKAKQWYDEGVYCIFAAAGQAGTGMLQQAAEYREAGKNVWAIGVDSDQYLKGLYSNGSKSAVLTSMLKVVENSTIDALTKTQNGTWKGGVETQNLSTEGVGYSKTNTALCEDAIKAADAAKADMLAGKIVPPKTYAEALAKGIAPAGLQAIDD